MDATNETSTPQLRRELGLRDGVAIVAGSIIGSGIFLVPSSVAGELRSLAAVLSLWIAGGVLTLFGALSLGELGAAFPGAGGIYIYLEKAY
jgi:APA family basic amino acid/polyamine antiporter